MRCAREVSVATWLILPALVEMGFRSPHSHPQETAAPIESLEPRSIPATLWSRCLRHLQHVRTDQSTLPPIWRLTSHCLLDIVKNKIHQLVIAFESANDYANSQLQAHAGFARHILSLPPLNLTLTCLPIYLVKSRMFSFLGFSA